MEILGSQDQAKGGCRTYLYELSHGSTLLLRYGRILLLNDS